MSQRERLREIQKKHERANQRRKALLRRIILGIAAIAVVLAAVFGIKSCVSSVAEKREQKRLEELAAQATPVPVETAVPILATEISQEYYKNSAFIGNSFIDGMTIYELIDDADYFAKIGLGVDDAMTEKTATGTVPVIEELNCEKKYDKIFMMFGENELGWSNSDMFVSHYSDIIDKVKEYQPQSKIYLFAITPVSKKVSEENVDNTNNSQILMYNELIETLAEEKGVIYADIHSAVASPDGSLPEDAASDGIHFGAEYYEKCLLYVQNNIN